MNNQKRSRQHTGDKASKPWIPVNDRLIWISCLLAGLFLCAANTAHAVVGAVVPFTSLEAEDGYLGGGATVVSLTSAPTS